MHQARPMTVETGQTYANVEISDIPTTLLAALSLHETSRATSASYLFASKAEWQKRARIYFVKQNR